VQSDSSASNDNSLSCALDRSILSFCRSRLKGNSKVSAYLKQLNVSSLYIKPYDDELAIKLVFDLR
jgi:hypothetical protein